jgi:hypothetical protein
MRSSSGLQSRTSNGRVKIISNQTADLIAYNGKVATQNEQRSIVEAGKRGKAGFAHPIAMGRRKASRGWRWKRNGARCPGYGSNARKGVDMPDPRPGGAAGSNTHSGPPVQF